MSILREFKELRKYLFQTNPDHKKIVFYAEHEGYYSYFEGIINELTEKQNIHITYITSDKKDPVFDTENDKIHPFYFSALLPFLMVSINCKVFVMTLTDLNKFHLKRSFNPVKYVYVFHSLVSVHMVYRFGAFDHYDSILCVGSHHIEEFEKIKELYNPPDKLLVKAGYYRLERVHNNYIQYKKSEINSSKKKILIAPSWGKENIIEKCGKKLVNKLLESGYSVIVRPHPETVRRCPDLIKDIHDSFSSNTDFLLETSVSTDDSLLQSDLLICDCSGVALEYSLGTERPVLFLDVPYKIQNDRYKEVKIETLELQLRTEIGKIVSLDCLDTINEEVDSLISEKDKYKVRIQQIREKYVFDFGMSSEIGAKHIMKFAGNIK